jgi:crotonobetainyl-CoA:carnitine CoA-transferase CaiB-like acyl-CoA transferase
MIVEVDDALAGTVRIAGNPIKMDSLPEEPTRDRVPEIGEHNEEVFAGLLGLSPGEIARLRDEGVC